MKMKMYDETPMLFPITPGEFWKQIRTTIEDAVTEKLSQQTLSQTNSRGANSNQTKKR